MANHAGHGTETASLRVWRRREPASGCLGGDWVDVVSVPGGRVGLTIDDACGHDD
ncbi:MAG: hypothetical protein IRZ08_03380 [Frankia sp.]|nr:hypothetical protein [Frankia sp.]